MRMHPPVPSGIQRAPEKGSGGHWIGSQYVTLIQSTLPALSDLYEPL